MCSCMQKLALKQRRLCVLSKSCKPCMQQWLRSLVMLWPLTNRSWKRGWIRWVRLQCFLLIQHAQCTLQAPLQR